ncbi:hypothetical protein MY4038_006073 [Beauveria bassiana]
MHTKPGPAVLYMHGGGFVALGVETFARKLHALVLASGVTIYAVDYRLAPEHPYPTPLEDCWTSLQYIRDHAATLGVDVARIAVMGDSAGGNLAAGVTLLGRQRGITPPNREPVSHLPYAGRQKQGGNGSWGGDLFRSSLWKDCWRIE